MNTEKTCTGCGASKPVEDFHKHKRNKDGLRHDCKACAKKSRQRYHETCKEAYNQRRREQYAARKLAGLDTGDKPYDQEKAKARNAARKEQRAERQRKYREENWQALNAKRRAYREANRERINQYNNELRIARKLSTLAASVA